MAELQGGTSAPARRRAGGSRPGAPRGAGFNPQLMAMNIDARKSISRRDGSSADREFQEIMGGDTQLSDESLGGSDERSVLDAVQARSYTDEQSLEIEGPLAGGGMMSSQVEELEAARQRERQMRRTQSQFTGEHAGGSSTSDTEEAQSPQRQESGAAEAEEEAEEEEEEDHEQQAAFEMQRAQSQAAQEVKNKVAENLKERFRVKMQNRMAKRSANTGVRTGVEGAEFAGSEVVVPLILFVLQLNVQMVNKYIFTPMLFKGWNEQADEAIDGMMFFDQSFPEDVLTVFVDIIIAIAVFMLCATFLIIVAAIAMSIDGAFQVVSQIGDAATGR
ncbi:hypothetical protein KBC59_00890 [Patescibacteria group bacterium]|nr:hypothetical protein [Patescibacteria group bacterium]